LLEKHELAAGILGVINGYLGDRGLSLRQGTIVDATLIHAPSSTKNQDGKRDPEMHQSKKGNQYYFGMKAHIGVDDESGLVHSVVGTAANVADVTQVDKLLHGEETTEHNRHIRCLLAGDCELVHHLQLHILGYAVLPEACPVYAGCLALENLHIVGPDHLAIDVGKHPRQIRVGMLQYPASPADQRDPGLPAQRRDAQSKRAGRAYQSARQAEPDGAQTQPAAPGGTRSGCLLAGGQPS